MKIWGMKSAGNPLRVAIFLEEKGLDIPFQSVDLFKGEHRTPEYLAKNPFSQVPVLELDDGTCISETVAICRFFERLHPEPPMMGTGALGEAVAEMWHRRVEINFYEPVRAAFRHSQSYLKPLEPVQIAEWAELSRAKVTTALVTMEPQLQRHRFIAGDAFTMADITAALSFQVMGLLEIPMPDDCPGVTRWRDELLARPSFVAATTG